MATINISLPQSMYKDAKKAVVKRHYASISELMRDALRRILYEDITENGFTREFEDHVIAASATPQVHDTVIETKEDLEKFFKDMHKTLEKKRKRI